MDPLKPMIDALHSEGRLRVWSLVITVFGDLVQHRGGVISTARLGQIMGRIGIERGTVRTALSRLGRDGWVESERQGRTSLYRLSAQGLARFAPATSLIYAAPNAADGDWSLYVELTGTAPRFGLVPEGRVPGGADCVVTGRIDRLSEAWRQTLFSDDVRAALDALAADITTLRTAGSVSPLDAAAARVLLIHRWRRLVLRHGEPVAQLLPSGAALPDPRAAVAEAYASLSAGAETWLDQPAGDAGPMPAADAGFASRFGGLCVSS